MAKHPKKVDFSDFPGYMRAAIQNMLQFSKDNSSLVKALTVAALLNGEIADEGEQIDIKDYSAISELFGPFDGVDVDYKNSLPPYGPGYHG